MNYLQGQTAEMFIDKNVSACKHKELTHNVVKDICVDEGVHMMQDAIESKSLEDKKFEELVDTKDTMELVVTEDSCEGYHEASCEKSPPEDVLARSGSVSNKAITLGDIISMENSHKPLNNVNTYEAEGNLGREIEQRKKGEKKSVSWRYLPSEMVEPENQRLNNVLVEDTYDHHHLFSSNFPNEAESGLAHITYSGPISTSGSVSARSDGSTVSGNSFAFPILQREWNSSPVRMVKTEKRQLQKDKGWGRCCLFLSCRF